MSEQKKVWIYGRFSEPEKNELLSYQIDLLTEYAHEIVGSIRAIDLGKSLESIFMQYLINSIISEFMDCILVYSTNRLFVDPEKFEELELICRIHNISIITIK